MARLCSPGTCLARASVSLLLEETCSAPWCHDISASVWGQTTCNSLPTRGCRSRTPWVFLHFLPFCGFGAGAEGRLEMMCLTASSFSPLIRSNDRHRLCARPWGRCWGHTENKTGPGCLLQPHNPTWSCGWGLNGCVWGGCWPGAVKGGEGGWG